MIYVIPLDIIFDSYSAFLAEYLIDRGWAVLDPPYRDGGYRIGSDALYRRIQKAALKRPSGRLRQIGALMRLEGD